MRWRRKRPSQAEQISPSCGNAPFVRTRGSQLVLGDRPFQVRGANNYYLGFAPDSMAAPVFKLAKQMGLNALRTWAFLDCGEAERESIPRGAHYGAFFHYLDSISGTPAFNDGPDGLKRLDRTIALAEEYDLRLILPLVNYWDDFGGIQQYLNWFGLSNRAEFYTHPDTRQAFRDYIEHLLLRVNSLTGRRYSDEPAILAWELANEPRCVGADGMGFAGSTEILLDWIREMSAWLKELDGNHLVSVGDEGYFGAFGVDCKRILEVDTIDFGTCHYYPHFAGQLDPVEFGRRWIQERIEAGNRAKKPMIVEEYGWKADPLNPSDTTVSRKTAFDTWLRQVEESQGAGALLWMIASVLPDGERYPDYDGYTVYAGEETGFVPAFIF